MVTKMGGETNYVWIEMNYPMNLKLDIMNVYELIYAMN